MNTPDIRSNGVTVAKWIILAGLAYILLHPIGGIYETTSYKDTIFILTFMAGVMGVEIPLSMLRKSAWRKDVEKALHTEPPKE